MSAPQADGDGWIAFAAEREEIMGALCIAVSAVVLALLLCIVTLAQM